MKHLRWILAASIVLNIAIVGLIGPKSLIGELTNNRDDFPFLSPRIFAQNQHDLIINFTALRSELRSFVSAKKNLRAGVYFEYLPSGVSIGVNEKEEFISASLLKTPFIIGILKAIENGAIRMDDVLTLEQSDLDPNFGRLWERGVGSKLTVEEAIRLALTQSDNTATRLLDRMMPEDMVRLVYNALDVPISFEDENPVVSAKNHSSVFRCLYLSCFLDFADSQKILSLLTQSIFTNGISAGVPGGVPLAHKVGIYDSPNSDMRVRSDCGIVYVPKRPYILCIMGESTKGQEQLITDFAAEISNRVYRFVASQ